MRRGLRRGCLYVLLAVVQLAVCVGVPATFVVARRVDRVDITFPADAPGDTWVIVGADRRSDDLPDAVLAETGTPEQYPGVRADVVLVVHRDQGSTRVLSIPRDVFVRTADGWAGRLTSSVQDGHQALVDALCHSLGVAADHLVEVDMAGFVDLVDVIGPIEVTIDAPILDFSSDLHLKTPGRHLLDSATALALVRSRHPLEFVDGEWNVVPEGELRRAGWATVVLLQVLSSLKAQRWDPLVMVQALWAVTGGLTVDSSTGLLDARALMGDLGNIATLDTEPLGDALVRVVTDTGRTQLADLGFGATCS